MNNSQITIYLRSVRRVCRAVTGTNLSLPFDVCCFVDNALVSIYAVLFSSGRSWSVHVSSTEIYRSVLSGVRSSPLRDFSSPGPSYKNSGDSLGSGEYRHPVGYRIVKRGISKSSWYSSSSSSSKETKDCVSQQTYYAACVHHDHLTDNLSCISSNQRCPKMLRSLSIRSNNEHPSIPRIQ